MKKFGWNKTTSAIAVAVVLAPFCMNSTALGKDGQERDNQMPPPRKEANDQPVELRITPRAQVFQLGSDVTLQVQLVNRSNDMLCVPTNMSVSTTIESGPERGETAGGGPLAINLRRNGESVRYLGNLVNVPIPDANGFACLRPGMSLGTEVSLVPGSPSGFDIRTQGRYSVRAVYRSRFVSSLQEAVRHGAVPRECILGLPKAEAGAGNVGWRQYWSGSASGEAEFTIAADTKLPRGSDRPAK